MSGVDYKHTNTTHELRDIHLDGSINCCVHRINFTLNHKSKLLMVNIQYLQNVNFHTP